MNDVLNDSVQDPPNSPTSLQSSPCPSCLGFIESSDDSSDFYSDHDSSFTTVDWEDLPPSRDPENDDLVDVSQPGPFINESSPVVFMEDVLPTDREHASSPEAEVDDFLPIEPVMSIDRIRTNFFDFIEPLPPSHSFLPLGGRLKRNIVTIDPFNCHQFIFSAVNTVPEYNNSVYGTAQLLTDNCPELLGPMTLFVDWVNKLTFKGLKTPPLVNHCLRNTRKIEKRETKDILEFHFKKDYWVDLTFVYDIHPGQKFCDPSMLKYTKKVILDDMIYSLSSNLFLSHQSRVHRVKSYKEKKPYKGFLTMIRNIMLDQYNEFCVSEIA